jgi:hypothetical protein
MVQETVESRIELRLELSMRLDIQLWHGFDTRKAAEDRMRKLIFHWDAVVLMARFIYRVARSWHFFGRKLPTMVSELAPNSDAEEDPNELE